jgi:hypothetical protein
MLTTDRISGSALVVLAALVIWESRHLPLGTFRQPGPAYIPILVALLLLIFGAALISTGRRAPPLSSIHWSESRHALAILAACVFAVFALERLGYRPTVILIMGFLLKIVEKRGWMLSIALSLALAFGSFFLFSTILRVPLPEGRFGF